MEKLSLDDLKLIVRDVSKNFPERIYNDLKIYKLATAVLCFYLGDDWVSQNASMLVQKKVLLGDRKGRGFLRTGNLIAEESFRHELRILQLGEFIFNLQSVDGLEERISLIKEGGLEATYAELECAAQIKKASLQFHFAVRSGIKGKDYDIEIKPDSGARLNCELKVTTEEKDLRKSTIVNKLNAARKQLPDIQPGIIFLKIPESWHKHANAQQLLSESIDQFFRNTNRVVAVVLRWEELIVDLGKPKPAVLKIYFQIKANNASKLFCTEVENILWQLNNPLMKGWIRFRDVVEQVQD